MKAIVLFDRNKLDWHLVQLNLSDDFVMSLDRIKRGFSDLGRARFPHILEVELVSFKLTGDRSYSWSSIELPKTKTIDECIIENRANIINCLKRLK